jgi:hypothetical protein
MRDYIREQCSLLGCDTVVLQVFNRDLMLPSSVQKSKAQKKKKQSDMGNIKTDIVKVGKVMRRQKLN